MSEQDARAEDKGKTIKRARVTIYGVVMPALTVTKGKTRGAAIVATDVVWLLDLTAVKGLSNYARGLLHQPVAAIGSAEITDEGGVLKRKLKVNWMEPLQDPDVPPPILNRNGRGLSQYFPVSRGGK